MKHWVGNAWVVKSLLKLPKVGERIKYKGLCVSVELSEIEEEEYLIYNVYFTDNKKFDRDIDVAHWSYAIRKDDII